MGSSVVNMAVSVCVSKFLCVRESVCKCVRVRIGGMYFFFVFSFVSVMKKIGFSFVSLHFKVMTLHRCNRSVVNALTFRFQAQSYQIK